MITPSLVIGLIVVSFNYNFYQLSNRVLAITRRRYNVKRYVDYLLGVLIRFAIAAGLSALFHFFVSPLTEGYNKPADLLVLLLALINGSWTWYEVHKIKKAYRQQSAWM
jgi:hypothetical protein